MTRPAQIVLVVLALVAGVARDSQARTARTSFGAQFKSVMKLTPWASSVYSHYQQRLVGVNGTERQFIARWQTVAALRSLVQHPRFRSQRVARALAAADSLGYKIDARHSNRYLKLRATARGSWLSTTPLTAVVVGARAVKGDAVKDAATREEHAVAAPRTDATPRPAPTVRASVEAPRVQLRASYFGQDMMGYDEIGRR
jgi:hypothetical protein